MRAPRWLLAIWFCFIARAFFYCSALPLWEGYDEWSHFAVVQRMAFRGGLIAHRPGSPVAAFYHAAASWTEFLARFAAFKSPLLPPPVVVALWICYAAATLGLVSLTFAASRRESSP